MLAERVSHGTAPAACGDVPPFSWAWDSTVRCDYNPDAARRLLADAGWTMDSDRIFVRDGKALRLELVLSAGQTEPQTTAILLQWMLRAVGIDVQLHAYDAATLFALAANGGILETGRFDLDVSGFINRPDPDDSRLLTCANRAPRGFNVSRYCSPEMETAQRESLETFDRAKRKRAISRIEHLVVRDVQVVYLSWPRNLQIINSDVSGIATPSGIATELPYQWSI